MKTNMDTPNDGLENVSPFKYGHFWYLCQISGVYERKGWVFREGLFGRKEECCFSIPPIITCAMRYKRL